MLELMSDPNTWVAFLTLTVMEIVLGVDNVIFISVLVSKLPQEQADRARKIGLALALVFRILLLLILSWLIALSQPVFTAFGHGFSWRDIILVAGGLFLIYKATHEMHAEIEDPHEPSLQQQAKAAMSAIITQIILIDMVFSIDSIVTAIGMAQHVEVMIAAVVVAVALMFVASGPISSFVARHPTTKMLALAFLLMIGVSLVADGVGFHIEKGYIYAAMGFSVLVEAFNILAKQRKLRRGQLTPGSTANTFTHREVTAVPGARSPVEADADAARARPKTNSTTRAQSRPKSAPRKRP